MEFEDKIKALKKIVNKGDLDEYGWHLVQLTKDEALRYIDLEIEKDMTENEVINVQLFQIRKCSDRFFDSIGKVSKFPPSLIILTQHDLCVNAHLNLPNDDKYNFTWGECLEWVENRAKQS